MAAGTRFTYDGGAVQVAASSGDSGAVLAVSAAAVLVSTALIVTGATNLQAVSSTGAWTVSGSLTVGGSAGGTYFAVLTSSGGTSVTFGVSAGGLMVPAMTSGTSVGGTGWNVYLRVAGPAGQDYFIPARTSAF